MLKKKNMGGGKKNGYLCIYKWFAAIGCDFELILPERRVKNGAEVQVRGGKDGVTGLWKVCRAPVAFDV